MFLLKDLFSLLPPLCASSWRVSPWWLRDERSAIERSVLRLLRVAHFGELDAAPLIEALALEHWRLPRFRLRKLAKRLRSGTPLIESLEQTPGILSDENILRIRFAFHSGTLGETWDAIINQEDQTSAELRFQLKQTLIHQGCVLCVIVLLMSYVSAFIVPTFAKLMAEFYLNSDSSSQQIGYVMYYISGSFGGLFLLFIVVSLGCWLLKPLRYFRRTFASAWFPSVSNLRAASLLRMLSFSNQAGRPLAGSLSTLAKYHYDKNIRGKLLVACNEVEQGVEPWSSLSNNNIGILTDNETKALRESSTPPVRSWIMLRLASSKEDHVLGRAAIFVSFIHPLITLVFAMFVLWITMAFFSDFSQMITSLC